MLDKIDLKWQAVTGNDVDPFLDDAGLQSSRWQMNIGVRYIFE